MDGAATLFWARVVFFTSFRVHYDVARPVKKEYLEFNHSKSPILARTGNTFTALLEPFKNISPELHPSRSQRVWRWAHTDVAWANGSGATWTPPRSAWLEASLDQDAPTHTVQSHQTLRDLPAKSWNLFDISWPYHQETQKCKDWDDQNKSVSWSFAEDQKVYLILNLQD